MLKVEIKQKHLKAWIKGKESEPIIDGDLCEKVKVEDTFWTVD